ncbi:hypothetical protein D3C85_1118990 [compost metagenome]
MTKTIKTMLASLLAVPVLAFGVVALAPAAVNAQAATPTCDPATNTSISGGLACSKPTDTNAPTNLFGVGGIFTTIVNILLFIIGAISVIMLIIGGIRYTISGGDSSAVTSAKNTIMYAIVGIIVAVLAYAIVNFVLTSLVAS